MRLQNDVSKPLLSMQYKASLLHSRSLVSQDTRKKIESMRKEIQELRSQRDAASSSTRSESVVGSSHANQGDKVAEALHDLKIDLENLSLDDVLVETPLAEEALRVFADLFLPQFPIIGSISATRMYNLHPLLLWTILMIVFSHHRDKLDDTLYERLNEAYVKQLRTEILDAPLPLHKIQSLLLLCIWPMPVIAQACDPSWLYCGMAIHASRYMGLDRGHNVPSLRSLGVVAGNADLRTNTWLGCFYTATSLSMQLGLHPPIEADLDLTAIQSFLARNTLPYKFEMLVRIQIVVAKYTNLFAHNISQDTSISFIRMIESELDVLQKEVYEKGFSSKKIEFNILDVKLHYYALLIPKLPPESSSRQIILTTGLAAALRMISISALQQPSSSAMDLMSLQRRRSLPKNYYRSLAFATIFLLKFFYLNSSTPPEDKQAAAKHIKLVQNVFSTCSISDTDEYARAAKVFESLARLSPGNLDSTMKLRLTHRMGVSILLDALSTAAEVRGRPVELGENETLDQVVATSESHPTIEEPSDGTSLTDDQVDSTMDFLVEFWDDPLLNMVNFDDLPSYD
ncbi:Putative transcription factor SEF1-like protein [Cladobotryum mycophilum]|uniref:Transcription factor SEF1-like protein n=1 Tax=Cladobotryum mycophilum TaxID=491253 RepID=A0ABR0T461_9HYPO